MAEVVKRTILITGGSRGIGRGICMAFAHADNHIYLTTHRTARLPIKPKNSWPMPAGRQPASG